MVLERRDCVASSADCVCEWNWCGQIYLIYIRTLASSLLNINSLIGLFACRRGSSSNADDHEGSGMIGHPSRFKLLYVPLCFVTSQVFDND